MSTISFLEGIHLDEGDDGLIWIPLVGVRPAKGSGHKHGEIVVACVTKCHLGYDDLEESQILYVPSCGAKNTPAKAVKGFRPQPPTEGGSGLPWGSSGPLTALGNGKGEAAEGRGGEGGDEKPGEKPCTSNCWIFDPYQGDIWDDPLIVTSTNNNDDPTLADVPAPDPLLLLVLAIGVLISRRVAK